MFKRLKLLALNYWQLFVLIIIFVISSYALFQPHLFRVHDYVHGARIAQMTLALKDGHFPVVWTRDFGFGYGMPLFQFYAPLPYYVGSFFYLVGFSLSNAVRVLFLVPNLVSLVGAYFLGKKLFQNKLSGALLATTFTLASYRGLNLFVRGAVSESWGMMTYPWILLASLLVIQKKRWGWLLLTFSLATLLLSHNLSVVMFLPFAVLTTVLVWLVYLWQKGKLRNLKQLFQTEMKTFFAFVGSYLLAFGLSAFYTVPAFLEKDFTQVEKMVLGGYFNYRLHFIYLRQLLKDNWGYGGSTWGPNDDISFFLGWGQWLGLALVLTVVIVFFSLVAWYLIRKQSLSQVFKPRLLKLLKVSLLAVSFLLMMGWAILLATEKTLLIWQSFEFLKFLQFPWRYLSVAVMFLSLVIAALPTFTRLFKFTLWRWLIFGLSGLVILIVGATSMRYFRPQSYLSNDQTFYYDDRERIAKQMSYILPDYAPSALNVKIKPNEGSVLVGPDWLLVESKSKKDEAKSKVLVDKTQATLVEFNLPKEVVVTFARAYYPGWKAEIDGNPTKLKVSKDGLIQVAVPKGAHKVGLYLADTPVRAIGKWISFTSLVILTGVMGWVKIKN